MVGESQQSLRIHIGRCNIWMYQREKMEIVGSDMTKGKEKQRKKKARIEKTERLEDLFSGKEKKKTRKYYELQ